MINMDYYKASNIVCKTMNAGLGVYECEFYYRPKHGREDIFIASFKGTPDSLARDKAKWLLEEANITNICNPSARHAKRGMM